LFPFESVAGSFLSTVYITPAARFINDILNPGVPCSGFVFVFLKKSIVLSYTGQAEIDRLPGFCHEILFVK
jgi:hypothetical protein